MNQVDTRGLTLLAVAGFASAAAFRICDPLLPKLAQSFETTTGNAARVITAFAIAYGLLQLFYGPIGDRYGKYRVVAAATLACTVGSLGCATAGSLSWLILFRVIAGATAAGIVPLSMAWIGDTVPYAQRQATLARFLMGTIMGMAGGQFIGGFFADTLGWRWAFVLLAACYVVVGLLLHAELKRHATAQLHASPRPTSTSTARNGYLLDQFLRDSANHRTYNYGGSIAHRASFPLEVTGRSSTSRARGASATRSRRTFRCRAWLIQLPWTPSRILRES